MVRNPWLTPAVAPGCVGFPRAPAWDLVKVTCKTPRKVDISESTYQPLSAKIVGSFHKYRPLSATIVGNFHKYRDDQMVGHTSHPNYENHSNPMMNRNQWNHRIFGNALHLT